MASRHALLIGVSTYGEGVPSLPSARLDVEALQKVLADPQLGEIPPQQLRLLLDPARLELEAAIEDFYANKQSDDLLLLYFSGHGFREGDRQLLLSTCQSCLWPDGRSGVQRATTLPARQVRDYMDRSNSQRQVVILDCCFSGGFADGMALKGLGALAIEELLGGKGRAVLSSSDATEPSRAPESGDGLSLYTRFLVEAIQTGAAARQHPDWLDVEDLHSYVESRVREVEPTMTPQFVHTRKGHRIRVCRVRRDPSDSYRQKVQELAEKRDGVISDVYRIILEDYRSELGLQPDLAAQIEADVLQPYVVNQQNLLRYRDALQQLLQRDGQSGGRLSHQDREELQELAQHLNLRPDDVAAIHQELGLKEREIPSGSASASSESLRSEDATSVHPSVLEPRQDQTDGFPLIQFATKRGWLAKEGKQWQVKTEPITATGYELELAQGIPLKLVRIPAGEFQMGSPAKEIDRLTTEDPQHLVKLKSFFLGQTPVTQAQWQVVAGWRKIQVELNPAPSRFQGPNRPVEQVSWQEAMEFCQRLSQHTSWEYSLPSEAQWEYACRAETTTPFAFGETLTPEVANYDGNYSYASGPEGIYRQETTDVCGFPANAWGLHDMHGNVWEWCADHWHNTYNEAPADGGPWINSNDDDSWRLLRGGSWFNRPRSCRSASRSRGLRDNRDDYVGFRLCVFPPGLAS